MKAFFSRVKTTVVNLLVLTLPALIVLVLILEIGVRWLFPVSDFPDTTFHPVLGNHFAPNQRGIFIRGPNREIRSEYRINSTGWNSPRDYRSAKPADTIRVAVIGDSFIEALHVDHDKSYPVLIENGFNKKSASKLSLEAYSFGHSGAQLAQYLNVLREVARDYRPDLVIINIVHNDFQESLTGYSRIDNLSLTRAAGGFKEIAPAPAGNLRTKRFLRNSALARYLILNLDIASKLGAARKILYGNLRRYEANVDVSGIDSLSENKTLGPLLRYLFTQYQKTLEPINGQLLLVVDANRGAIYSGKESPGSASRVLIGKTLETAGKLGIAAIDLTGVFRAAWERDQKKFEWEFDGHWNGYAHRVIADAVGKWIRSNSKLTAPTG